MGGIFDPGADNSVDFSIYDKDMTTISADRLLEQFKNSTALNQLATCLAEMEQNSYDAAVSTMNLRILADAEGVNLDVIGEIVGQKRELVNTALKFWFGPDGIDPQIVGPDSGFVWAVGASLAGFETITDPAYRRLILSKIFKNHVKVGSMPEILRFAQVFNGRNISMYNHGNFDLDLIVPLDTPINDVLALVFVKDDKTADRKYYLPLPATARLLRLWYEPDQKGWGFDSESRRWDSRKYAIAVPLT